MQKGDETILRVTSRDIVAAEAHYHVSCYKNYTRGNTSKPEYEDKSEKENDTAKDPLYQVIEREAHSNLFEYITTDIIPNKKITPITSLTVKLESFMSGSGVKLMTDSTRKHIRRRLESELGDSVDIFQDDKGKLVYVLFVADKKDRKHLRSDLHDLLCTSHIKSSFVFFKINS